ncbi:Cytosolic iron-sulfur protein assembly protein [Maublancomyces gigas]|uniref:Probable cytosolic iron-sulfur protein assembly protein 1 n=1 Tax=Discina gigas TaxID=1032678 RepID=A0ABR3GJA6_9PEZI
MKLQKITSLPPHPDRIWSIAVHPTLPLIATASSDRTSRISSLLTYRALSTIDGGHKRSIRSVAWKPAIKGESVLATGSFDATAGIWRRFEDDLGSSTGGEYADDEEEEWRFAVVLDGHENEVKCVAWSAGGNFLATCSRDKTVWVWEEMEEDNFETIAVLQDHTQDVKCVTWHPEEELLASSSYDDTVRLYREDVDDWVCCALLEGHTSTVWCIDFEKPGSPHYVESRSSRLASCSDDLSIRIWTRVSRSGDASTVKAVPSILRGAPVEEEWVHEATLPKVHTRAVYSVSWSARSGRIVSCGGDGKVAVYEEVAGESEPGPESEPCESESEPCESEQAKPRSEWKVVAELEGAHDVFEVNGVAWSKRWDKGRKSDGEEIIASCGDDGVVSMWELVD